MCSSHACSHIPTSGEDLTRDIYSHFSHSSKRLNTFKEFQSFCELRPHKILSPLETRWLSKQQVVDRILEQYDALLLYFTNAAFEEQSAKIDNILAALKNKVNKMYLYFLSYVLKIINNINIEFQSEKRRLHQLLPRVSLTFKQILKNFLKLDVCNSPEINKINHKDPSNFLPLENMYFGYKAQEIIDQHQIDSHELHNFRLKCLNFYIDLSSQIKDRFPFGNELYQQLTWFDPRIFSDLKAPSIIPLVKRFPNMVNENLFENINSEWRMLSELPKAKFNENMDLEIFIIELGTIKNSLGENLFPNLYTFLKNIICLPHGSAAAERVFSALNLIKRKNRNLLDVNTCHNLLLSKEMLRLTTCYDWEPPSEMLKFKK